MELLAGLDLRNTADFFTTFFRLPPYLWRNFLASKLSSGELLGFALATFALAPPNIQVRGDAAAARRAQRASSSRRARTGVCRRACLLSPHCCPRLS